MPTKKLSSKTKAALKKAVAKENRRINLANKAFQKMTRAEKRVQIARDVLAQIAIKRLIPKNFTWLTGKDDTDLLTAEEAQSNADLKDLLAKKKQCEGCALGGMFMCAIERADALKVGDLVGLQNDGYTDLVEKDIFGYMQKFFSLDQLRLIEAAFEQGEGASSDERANYWAPNVTDATDRMRLIMENIIVHKGKFDPSKEPSLTYVTPGFVG